MKKSYMFLLPLFLLVIGCLTYESSKVHVVFADDTYQKGKVTITYFGMSSTEDSLHKRAEDFTELLKFYQNDGFLLNEIDNGIYVKERRMFEENNQLAFSYSGIFRNVKIEGFEMRVDKDELIFVFKDKDDFVITKSNGKIERDSSATYIKWPKGQTDIYYETQNRDEGNRYSLLQYFKEWKSTQKN